MRSVQTTVERAVVRGGTNPESNTSSRRTLATQSDSFHVAVEHFAATIARVRRRQFPEDE